MQLTKFQNEAFGSVRVATINGEVFFVGKDVAEILGYTNPLKAIRDHVDDEDVRGERIVHPLGGEQETKLINESGLYSLILSSHMPKTRQFKRWVTSEVLPSICQHGVYATDELIENPDFLIKALEQLKAERAMRKELEMTALIQSQQIAELQPKASYCDIVLSCQDAINISVIAKDYGMSAKRMNRLLHELGIQFKQGRIWLLYQQYAECGYTKTSTSTYQNSSGQECSAVHTKWTQKGRLFLYDTLKAVGIYPKVE